MDTSSKNDHITVEIKLTIGQCKLLEHLVAEKLAQCEAGILNENQKPLKRLIDVFHHVTGETAEERRTRFENWVGSLRLVTGVKHG